MSASAGAIPFTVLSGFLGAGKTTVLNRILGLSVGKRVAVLVNELGRIAIDSRLIGDAGGDVLELAGGCVCCKVDVKSDLWYGIADIVERTAPDHIVLETTGIAEPPALIEGLERLPESLVDRIVPAGVVTVVDVETCERVLARHPEATVQIECADRIVLSKLDRASPAQLTAAHRRLGELNPACERASFPPGTAGDRALLDFVLGARPRSKPAAGPAGREEGTPGGHRHGPHHSHGQLAAVCFADEAPLVGPLVLAAIEALGSQLVRVKGYLHLSGQPRRGFLELAGSALTLTLGDPWGDEPPRTELVLIGDAIDDASISRKLWACRAAH